MNIRAKNIIENAFNLKVLEEQYYDWGEIYWLQLDEKAKKTQSTLSIVTVYPGKEQKVHVHPGFEEIIYGLEGEITHWCNGEEKLIGPGKLLYIPDNGEHRMLNTTEENAKLMSIVSPIIPTHFEQLSVIEDIDLSEITKLVNLDAILRKFADSVHLAVTLVDQKGKILATPKNFPEFCSFCLKQCDGDCVLYIDENEPKDKNLKVFRCKFGVYSVQSPIIINERVLGYLGCGYERVAKPDENTRKMIKKYFKFDIPLVQNAYMNLNIINRNHLKTVAETLSLVSSSLVQLIISSAKGQEISNYKLSLAKEKQRKAELEKSLSEARLKFLESQVNPHFLFNTLNTVAQTSLMEGATTAANITYALANLLRRSMGKADTLISIAEEIEHIKDYLFIQETRFPNKFEIEIDVDSTILSQKIPFMTMMILVENSIVHGFKDISWKGSLTIRGFQEGERVVLEVIDNGTGIDSKIIEAFNFSKKTNSAVFPINGIGLKNIYKRLEYYYGDSFALEIVRPSEKGTKITIKLPKS